MSRDHDQIRQEFEHALRRRDYATIGEVADSLGLADLADGARAADAPDAATDLVDTLPTRA